MCHTEKYAQSIIIPAARAVALEALDIHFAAGLGKGEMVGTEAGDDLRAVKPLQHHVQTALQVAHGDPLVHHQTLQLVEHGRT